MSLPSGEGPRELLWRYPFPGVGTKEPQRQLGDCRAAPTPSRGDPEVGTHAGGTLLCLVHSQRLQGSDRFSCTLLGKPLWKQIGLEPGGGGRARALGVSLGPHPPVKILPWLLRAVHTLAHQHVS